jgi:riboflavin kinase/FMN adenylyltransferase
VVITFDPPPVAVAGGTAVPRITSPARRIELLEACGVRRVWVLRADGALVRLRAREFLATYLRGALNAAGLLVGFDNRLGSDQAGGPALEAIGGTMGLEVRRCEPLLEDGEPISSTMARQAIVRGDLERAARLLGRPVELAGIVGRGAGRGAGLGCPTANLALNHEVCVPCGVYSGESTVEGERRTAAISVGRCPTFGGDGVTAAHGPYVSGIHVVEVHLLDFAGDLRGHELRVAVRRKLRDELKFPTAGALVEQMRLDIEAIRREAEQAAALE